MQSITKYISISIFLFIGFISSAAAQSDSTQTNSAHTPELIVKKGEQMITMKVPGICGMCKERIESTAMDVPGVKKAEWDILSDTLVLVGSSKMNKQKVAEALAKAGYRSDVCAADAKAYNKLPGCCQYDSGLEKH